MIIKKELSEQVMLILLKDFFVEHTVTSLAERLEMSRVGIWKILKKIEIEGLIVLEKIGKGKTSTFRARLNWKNILVERSLSLYLAREALRQERWRSNFFKLEPLTSFVILYGSVLHSSKKANDIDLVIVSDKKNFLQIEKVVREEQMVQAKEIHDIGFTSKEFRKELENHNKAFLEAVRKGVILFGQERFIKFIKGLSK